MENWLLVTLRFGQQPGIYRFYGYSLRSLHPRSNADWKSGLRKNCCQQTAVFGWKLQTRKVVAYPTERGTGDRRECFLLSVIHGVCHGRNRERE